MGLTRSYKETVKERALKDSGFRRGLFVEGVECLLAGELNVGKSLLRDYINATLGFERLAKLTKKSSKSLMRMFSENGNPRAENIFSIISILQKKEGIRLQVKMA